MKQILVVGEDALCCALGLKLVAIAMPGWTVSSAPINTRGVTKLLAALPRYVEQAKHVRPVLCLADTDRQCPVDMRTAWLPKNAPQGLHFRLAVPEAESWVLGDREAFADFFRISRQKIPVRPEELRDAKLEVLRLARISKVPRLRQEVVSSISPEKPGVGYNLHLCALVGGALSAARSAETVPSLRRAVERLSQFAAA